MLDTKKPDQDWARPKTWPFDPVPCPRHSTSFHSGLCFVLAYVTGSVSQSHACGLAQTVIINWFAP